MHQDLCDWAQQVTFIDWSHNIVVINQNSSGIWEMSKHIVNTLLKISKQLSFYSIWSDSHTGWSFCCKINKSKALKRASIFQRKIIACAVNNPNQKDELSKDHPVSSVCMCLSVGLCVSYLLDPCWEQRCCKQGTTHDVLQRASVNVSLWEYAINPQTHANVRTMKQVWGPEN